MEFTLSEAEGFRAAASGRPNLFARPGISFGILARTRHARGDYNQDRAGAEAVLLYCARFNSGCYSISRPVQDFHVNIQHFFPVATTVQL
jgi:hypothetical protein